MHITTGKPTEEEVYKILLDEEMYERISDDNCPQRELFSINIDYFHLVGGYLDGEIVSLLMTHPSEKYGKETHFMCLKPYRRYSRLLWRACSADLSGRVLITIPSLYRDIINFSMKEGFTEMEVIKDAHKKNGISYDMHIMVKEM